MGKLSATDQTTGSNQPYKEYDWQKEFRGRNKSDDIPAVGVMPAAEFNRLLMTSADIVVHFAQAAIERPEIVRTITEATQIRREGPVDHDEFSLLREYASYYCWKHGLPELKSGVLSQGYQLIDELKKGHIKSLNSNEARRLLREDPFIY